MTSLNNTISTYSCDISSSTCAGTPDAPAHTKISFDIVDIDVSEATVTLRHMNLRDFIIVRTQDRLAFQRLACFVALEQTMLEVDVDRLEQGIVVVPYNAYAPIRWWWQLCGMIALTIRGPPGEGEESPWRGLSHFQMWPLPCIDRSTCFTESGQ